MKTTLATIALLVASATAVLAQAQTPVIDARQAAQQKRIEQGVASGQLNAKEAARLQNGQAKVQALEDKAKADGVVTKSERQGIKKAQNVQSKHIAKQKHDAQTAR